MLVLERSELHELCAQVSSGDVGTRLYVNKNLGMPMGVIHLVSDKRDKSAPPTMSREAEPGELLK